MVLVLGQSCEQSCAPTPSKRHRPQAGAAQARGGEKEQRAAGKECKRVKYSRDGRCRQNLLEKIFKVRSEAWEQLRRSRDQKGTR